MTSSKSGSRLPPAALDLKPEHPVEAFAPDWLALREPQDHQARAAGGLEKALPRPAAWRAIDLGGGTGSNLRYLMPRIGGAQHWQLCDHDPALLAAAPAAFQAWASRNGYRCLPPSDGLIALSGEGWSARIEPRILDLTSLPAMFDPLLSSLEGPADPILPPGASAGPLLVTAAALLDLVSASWLEALIAGCAARGALLLFALTYDGEIEWSVDHPFDGAIHAVHDDDQRRDKGLGPALGPRAADAASAALSAAGYRVSEARSDWQLGALPGGSADLQRRFVEDLARLACSRGVARDRVEAWRQARQAAITSGRAELRVGHRDLLALPR